MASSDAKALLVEVFDCLSQLLKDPHSETCSLKLSLADDSANFSKPWQYCASKKQTSRIILFPIHVLQASICFSSLFITSASNIPHTSSKE